MSSAVDVKRRYSPGCRPTLTSVAGVDRLSSPRSACGAPRRGRVLPQPPWLSAVWLWACAPTASRRRRRQHRCRRHCCCCCDCCVACSASTEPETHQHTHITHVRFQLKLQNYMHFSCMIVHEQHHCTPIHTNGSILLHCDTNDCTRPKVDAVDCRQRLVRTGELLLDAIFHSL